MVCLWGPRGWGCRLHTSPPFIHSLQKFCTQSFKARDPLALPSLCTGETEPQSGGQWQTSRRALHPAPWWAFSLSYRERGGGPLEPRMGWKEGTISERCQGNPGAEPSGGRPGRDLAKNCTLLMFQEL